MKPLNLKFKIASLRATVKATTLKNAVNLSILIHNNGQYPDIDRTKLRNIVRELTGNPINGFVPNKFIATFHTTPKFTKVNVTLLSITSITKDRIKTTAMDIILRL